MIETPTIGLPVVNPRPAEKFFARRYLGPEARYATAREVRKVEAWFGHPGEFDDILHGQLELALGAGRAEVVVLDIGSGRGELFANFLRDPNVGKKSRAFLMTHPGFKVRGC